MFFVSFHGGAPTTQVPNPINNIYAYDDDGNALAEDVLSPGGQTLDELRGLYLVPGSGLYVLNGSKDTSNILCFTGSGTSYGSPSVFASAATTAAIDHPFAAAFDGKSQWYVSNQDTNVVATLRTQSGQSAAAAGPLGDYLHALYPNGTFLASTLIASAVIDLPKVTATTKVSKELGGLDALLDNDSSSSDDAATSSDKKSK